MLPDLLVPAMTVAMLGAIESLLSATVADRMTGTRHNPNVELIGQGVANIFSPLVGGLPATGAIARTATNIRSGAKTPVAGMIHAVTLLLILLFAAPLAAQVPLAVLAGLLFIVAYNMGEWHEIPTLLKMTKADIAVWFATFALTVVADLTVAVEVGMVLAALLFIRRVAETTSVARVTGTLVEEGRAPFAAGRGDSRLCRRVSHSRAVPLRRHRQARRRFSIVSRCCRPSSSCGFVMCRRWMPRDCRHSRILPIRCGFRAARCCCVARASSRRI